MRIAALLVCALALGSGCRKEPSRRERPRAVSSAGRVASKPAPIDSAKPPSKTHAPGQVPFDFPEIATSAKAGDFVLAPSRSWIDEAFAKEASTQTFIYYGAYMSAPGATASKIKTLPGKTETLPNAMILPVSSGESAKPGDVVLTAWASGSGLERAIVVGGEPTSPAVRYLDIDFDNPSGWGQKDDTLPAKTFHVLSKPGELGTTLACKDGERHVRWVVVARAKQRLLGLGFGGRMKVLDDKSCQPLPISPKSKPGDKVFVPVLGNFVEAKVTKVDTRVGRVTCKHEFGGKEREVSVGFGNLATSL